jgi:probable rRNA maturation factor
MISLLVRNGAGALVSVAMRGRLRRAMSRVCGAAGRPEAVVCLSLTDDKELHALNLQYAEEDHATDVLSFSQGDPTLLGDIVISVETAARQAKERGHGLFEELFHLSVHGFCHLLGYDHATRKEERVMFAYEAELRDTALRQAGAQADEKML